MRIFGVRFRANFYLLRVLGVWKYLGKLSWFWSRGLSLMQNATLAKVKWKADLMPHQIIQNSIYETWSTVLLKQT